MKRSVFRVVLLQLVSRHLSFIWQAFTTGSVTKATPIQFTDGKSGIKKRRGRKTALSSYYACLSRDLLLTASGADTHTHTHTPTFADETISRNQARGRAWFNEVLYGHINLFFFQSRLSTILAYGVIIVLLFSHNSTVEITPKRLLNQLA